MLILHKWNIFDYLNNHLPNQWHNTLFAICRIGENIRIMIENIFFIPINRNLYLIISYLYSSQTIALKERNCNIVYARTHICGWFIDILFYICIINDDDETIIFFLW